MVEFGCSFYYFDSLQYPTIPITLSNVHLKLLADIVTSELEQSILVHIAIIICFIHVNLRRFQIILNVCIGILSPFIFVWRISCSSLTQSTIEGLSLLSARTEREARLANMVTDSIVYELLLISGSITLRSFFLSFNICLTCDILIAVNVLYWKNLEPIFIFAAMIIILVLTCSTKFWSFGPRVRSTALRPVKSSSITTPNA